MALLLEGLSVTKPNGLNDGVLLSSLSPLLAKIVTEAGLLAELQWRTLLAAGVEENGGERRDQVTAAIRVDGRDGGR